MEMKLTPSIHYVGVDNTEIAKFENQYPLSHGMSFNSYLIVDEKIALLDSVEADMDGQWIRQIEDVIGDRSPDYLLVHHMEPDHSASIGKALDRWPGLKIVASAKAIAMMSRFHPDRDFSKNTLAVAEGDSLSLGSHTIQFFAAPMIHWPEVIVSYETTEKVLFTSDAFGKFGALQYKDDWVNEARRYFINIVGKYGAQVQGLLKKVSALDVKMIAPLHGPVLSGNPKPYIDLYDCWSSYRPETRGVLVAYSSIYGATAEAARRLAELLRQRNCGEIVAMDLCSAEQSEVIAQAFRLSAMVVAAPTYDGSIYPPMQDFLHHLVLKTYRNRKVGFIENGSWVPASGRLMRKMLEPLKGMEFVDPLVTITSRPDASTDQQLTALADAMAEGMKM